MPQNKSTTNLWGYDSGSIANISNTITVNYLDQEITEVLT